MNADVNTDSHRYELMGLDEDELTRIHEYTIRKKGLSGIKIQIDVC